MKTKPVQRCTDAVESDAVATQTRFLYSSSSSRCECWL